MQRIVEPELLDRLPVSDPKAIRSRRDLQRLNRLMGHAGIVAKNLERIFSSEKFRRIVELGAGDGMFLLRVAKRLSKKFTAVEALLVDQQNLLSAQTKIEFDKLGWNAKSVTADVFDFLKTREYSDCFVANLFLHHFLEEKLMELFQLASSQTKVFLACEPRRTGFPLLASHSLGLIGCNSVTRNDAPISVRAGFVNDELSQLWPERSWNLLEQPSGLFSHLFVAENLKSQI